MFVGLFLSALQLEASEKVTLIFTNDIHSRFNPSSVAEGPKLYGGIAKVHTLIQKLKQNALNQKRYPLVLDAGDWSEGSLHYLDGMGAHTIQLMNQMQYDAVVLGNHEWLNGPSELLKTLIQGSPQFAVLGANFEVSSFKDKELFLNYVRPSKTFQVGKAKISVIGFVTQELIYDTFIKPITILPNRTVAKKIVRKVRVEDQTDAMIGLSHNAVSENVAILKAIPELSLIIGAHDHKLLTEPKIVSRSSKDAWVVEAGSYGHHVGLVELTLFPEKPFSERVHLDHYQVYQVDESTPENKEIQNKVLESEERIEKTHDFELNHLLAQSEYGLYSSGEDSPLGNLAVRAYHHELNHTYGIPVDATFEQANFIYGHLPWGQILFSDVYSAFCGVYEPQKKSTWTLKVLPIRGDHLEKVLNALTTAQLINEYATISDTSMINISNLTYEFDPGVRTKFNFEAQQLGGEARFGIQLVSELLTIPIHAVRNIRIGGFPLEQNKFYKIGLGDGILLTINFLNDLMKKLTSRIVLPTKNIKESGLERWKLVSDYIKKQNLITPSDFAANQTGKSTEAFLNFQPYDMVWNENTKILNVTIWNYGLKNSSRRNTIKLLLVDDASIPLPIDFGALSQHETLAIPPIEAQKTVTLSWDLSHHLSNHVATNSKSSQKWRRFVTEMKGPNVLARGTLPLKITRIVSIP